MNFLREIGALAKMDLASAEQYYAEAGMVKLDATHYKTGHRSLICTEESLQQNLKSWYDLHRASDRSALYQVHGLKGL